MRSWRLGSLARRLARRKRLAWRWMADLLAELDVWIAQQPDPKPSRPEAIRRLVQLGIQASIPRNPGLNAAVET